MKRSNSSNADDPVEKARALKFARREWLILAHPPQNEAEVKLDEEDLARMRLIFQLQHDFGVNDEGIPIILHLLDQLYALRKVVDRLKGID